MANGGCPPKAPTDPYVRTLAHTAPRYERFATLGKLSVLLSISTPKGPPNRTLMDPLNWSQNHIKQCVFLSKIEDRGVKSVFIRIFEFLISQ